MVLDLGGSRTRPASPARPGSQLLYERVVAYVEELVADAVWYTATGCLPTLSWPPASGSA